MSFGQFKNDVFTYLKKWQKKGDFFQVTDNKNLTRFGKKKI